MAKKKADPQDSVVWATEEEFQELERLAESRVVNGELSDEDVDVITKAFEKQEEKGRLTSKQLKKLQKIVSDGVEKHGVDTISKPIKIFAILSLVGGFLTLAAMAIGIYLVSTSSTHVAQDYQGSTVEFMMMAAQAILFVVGCVLHVVLGVRLLKHKRYYAAHIAYALVIIGVFDIFFESMLTGFSFNLLFVVAITAFRVGLSAVLSPSLMRERKLADNILMADTKVRAETNTLGLDLDGKGYIKLDFFNIFWIFVVACFLGVIVEVLWHMIVVEPGVYQDRRGLLFGPFSPIYGIGAVLMTVALNRFKNANLIITFIVCTIIGGAFEYCVSWWLEIAFGVIAWDYHGKFLGDLFDGRTCLVFAMMFGMLGLWWIKWALPRLLALINKIPWKTRYTVTTVCALLMVVNIGMTLISLDCWQQRVNGEPVVSDVQKWYAENFPNDEMQSRFQSMTIKPQNK